MQETSQHVEFQLTLRYTESSRGPEQYRSEGGIQKAKTQEYFDVPQIDPL